MSGMVQQIGKDTLSFHLVHWLLHFSSHRSDWDGMLTFLVSACGDTTESIQIQVTTLTMILTPSSGIQCFLPCFCYIKVEFFKITHMWLWVCEVNRCKVSYSLLHWSCQLRWLVAVPVLCAPGQYCSKSVFTLVFWLGRCGHRTNLIQKKRDFLSCGQDCGCWDQTGREVRESLFAGQTRHTRVSSWCFVMFFCSAEMRTGVTKGPNGC